jgi:hypothetical protein
MSNENLSSYNITLTQSFTDGRAVSTRLLATRSRELAEKCADSVRAIVSELPPIRSTNPSNARSLRVIKVADYQRASNCKAAGRLKWIPNPGQKFVSVNDAARLLGVPLRTLHQALSRARIANNGSDASAVVFGLELAYQKPSEHEEP